MCPVGCNVIHKLSQNSLKITPNFRAWQKTHGSFSSSGRDFFTGYHTFHYNCFTELIDGPIVSGESHMHVMFVPHMPEVPSVFHSWISNFLSVYQILKCYVILLYSLHKLKYLLNITISFYNIYHP